MTDSMTDTMDLLYDKKIKQKKEPIKIYLNIPYKLKDEIKKSYPIKWNIKLKKWYTYDDTEAEQINKLIANFELITNNVVKPKKKYSYIL